MVASRLNLGLIVAKASDFGDLTMKIASKDSVFDAAAGNIPATVKLGDWVVSPSSVFETVTETSKIPLKSRVVNGKVQVFTYITVPLGHCSTRDSYILLAGAKVWSPHFGFAHADADLMFGIKEEILYEAWIEYRNGASGSEPIWALRMVGQPLLGPSITMLLKDAPWKTLSKRQERGDTSLSAVLRGGHHEVDGYHRGFVIAILNLPEPSFILYCDTYGGLFQLMEGRRVSRELYEKIAIGQAVKFREMIDPHTDRKYPHIKEILITTRLDVKFETHRTNLSQTIIILTSVKITDDLLKEEKEGSVLLHSKYGVVHVHREKFAKQMEDVYMDREDLLNAKQANMELQVWTEFVPISKSWSIDRIHSEFFTDKTME